mmetsp:Transcript_110977/g.264755  ORF Transcript_110977/g.264755 Transcript_110977/m.264755 type:complete len:339 (+) Transcript_110977:376-1392(+)
MWPEPPFRSSSEGSLLAFMDSTHWVRRSMSPSGSSTEVQKNWRPPMSAAPSISTPRLPPSLRTFFNLAFFCFSISSGLSSAGAAAFSSVFAPLSFFLSPFSFGAASFLGVASFLAAASFLRAASFLGAAFASAFSPLALPSLPSLASLPPWPSGTATFPRTFANSGWLTQSLNQRMRFGKGLRNLPSKTWRMASINAQQTEMSASVMLLPTMKVLWRQCLSSTVIAFATSSFAQAVASGTSAVTPIAGRTQVQRGTSSSCVLNSSQESIIPPSIRFWPYRPTGRLILEIYLAMAVLEKMQPLGVSRTGILPVAAAPAFWGQDTSSPTYSAAIKAFLVL